MDCTGNLLANVGAIQFLIKNFPDNILNPYLGDRKTYTSVMDFITDILKSLGVEPIEIVYLLLGKMTGLSDSVVKNMDKWIDSAGEIDQKYQSSWLYQVEEALKYAISAALSGILGCSADPMIGDKYFDCHYAVKPNLISEGGIVLKLSEIDPFGYLKHCPSSRSGKNYYFDNDMGINNLYRSQDFNAFLWYSYNKSLLAPQREINKNMWDNRYTIKSHRTEEEWNEWLSSKTVRPFDKNVNVSDDPGSLKLKRASQLKPIIQLTQVDTDDTAIRFQISSQEYYRNRPIAKDFSEEHDLPKIGFNKTLFEFNSDYLKSIPLFSVKTFLASIIDGFMNGINIDSFQLSVNRVLPTETIKRMIKKGIESVTTGADTCYFSFSNDEFNDMLDNLEAMRLNSKPLNSASEKMAEIDKGKAEDILSRLVSPDGDEKLTLKEAFTELSLVEIPGQDGRIEIKMAENWFEDFIFLIVYHLILPLFSPKIIFLFAFNYQMLGYDKEIRIEDLIVKMFQVILSMIVSIVKTIIQYLFELIWNLLMKSVTAYVAIRLLEMINDYIEMLYMAFIVCIPKFKLFDYGGGIDDVNYADIIPEKDVPEKDKEC